jgi:hypothetical protein
MIPLPQRALLLPPMLSQRMLLQRMLLQRMLLRLTLARLMLLRLMLARLMLLWRVLAQPALLRWALPQLAVRPPSPQRRCWLLMMSRVRQISHSPKTRRTKAPRPPTGQLQP